MAYADDAGTVNWMLPNFSPVAIAESEGKSLGIENVILEILTDQIPEYKHKVAVVNLNRLYEAIKNPSAAGACTVGIIKTAQREAFMHFGRVPSVFLTPVAAIIRVGDELRFGEVHGKVSLKSVLENETLKLGIPRKYVLSKPLTALLTPYIGKPHVYQQDMTKMMENILKMTAATRLDYTIAYPWMTNYISEKLHLKGRFTSLSISEDDSPIMYHAACTKNEWGRGMVARIDDILKEIRLSKKYRGAVERWLDKNSIPRYRALYKSLFLSVQ